jgi:hypothetical protein
MKELEKYRTLAIAAAGILALSLCSTVGGVKGEDLTNIKWGIVTIVGTVAGRSFGHAWTRTKTPEVKP